MRSGLRWVTGSALLLAAVGVYWDAAATRWIPAVPHDNGSIGLIPLYLGLVVGLPGLAIVIWRQVGPAVGVVATLGVVGSFVFAGSYPSYSTIGGLGGVLIGFAVLTLPGQGRFLSPFWVAPGILGIDELHRGRQDWGPIGSFTIYGVALALAGLYILFGLSDESKRSAA